MSSIELPKGGTVPSFPELSEEFNGFTEKDLRDDRTVIDWLYRALKRELDWQAIKLPDSDYFAVVIGQARGLLSQAPPSSFPAGITLHSNDPLINTWMDASTGELRERYQHHPSLPPNTSRGDAEFGAWLVGLGLQLLADPGVISDLPQYYSFFVVCAEKYL